ESEFCCETTSVTGGAGRRSIVAKLKPSIHAFLNQLFQVPRLPQFRGRVVNGATQLRSIRQHEQHTRDILHVYQRQHRLRSKWYLDRDTPRECLKHLGTPRRSGFLDARSDDPRNAKRDKLHCSRSCKGLSDEFDSPLGYAVRLVWRCRIIFGQWLGAL